MAAAIYALCALTAFACASMLLMGARRSRSRMLFWCALCFAGLALSNGLIVIDRIVPVDLGTLRLGISLVSVSLLLYGLIFEEK